MTNNKSNGYLVLGIIAIVVIIGLALLLRPKDDSTRVGRAIDEISEGVSDAADEMNPERKSTGDKIGEAVEDMGHDIKDAAGQ